MRRSLGFLIAISLLGFSSPQLRADSCTTNAAGQMLTAGAMIAMSTAFLYESIGKCICQTSPAHGCPDVFKNCATSVGYIATAGAGAMNLAQAFAQKSACNSAAGNTTAIKPLTYDLPQTDAQLQSALPPGTALPEGTSPTALLKQMCNDSGCQLTPEMQQNLEKAKDILANSNETGPNGLTGPQMAEQLDTNLASLNGALAGIGKDMKGSGLNVAGGADLKDKSEDQELADNADTNAASAAGSDDWANGNSKIKAGPSDRRGLGAAEINNGLTMTDSQTGLELTLWQRATRRYQGDAKGSRAYFLAKMEFVRRKAMLGKFPLLQARSTPQDKPKLPAILPHAPASTLKPKN